jgi:hypothetical protein
VPNQVPLSSLVVQAATGDPINAVAGLVQAATGDPINAVAGLVSQGAQDILGGVVGLFFSVAGGFIVGFGKQLVGSARESSGTYVIGLLVAVVVVFVLFR